MTDAKLQWLLDEYAGAFNRAFGPKEQAYLTKRIGHVPDKAVEWVMDRMTTSGTPRNAAEFVSKFLGGWRQWQREHPDLTAPSGPTFDQNCSYCWNGWLKLSRWSEKSNRTYRALALCSCADRNGLSESIPRLNPHQAQNMGYEIEFPPQAVGASPYAHRRVPYNPADNPVVAELVEDQGGSNVHSDYQRREPEQLGLPGDVPF